MKKTNLFLLLALLAALVTACDPQAQQAAQASGPRAWIDNPLDGSSLPLAACEVVWHGAHAAGVAQLELSVNGAVVATIANPDPAQTLVTARYAWTPPAPGNYTLQARAQSQPGDWGAPATAIVTVGGETEAPVPTQPTGTPTLIPEGPTAVPESTAAVPTDTPVPPTWTPVPPTWTPVPPTWTPVPPTWTPAPVLSADMQPDTNRPGMDYKDFDLSSPDPNLCRSACLSESGCLAYTYVKPGIQGASAHCWLKSGVPPAQADTCCISGVKPVTVTPKPQQAPTFPYPADASPDTIYSHSSCKDKIAYFTISAQDQSGVTGVVLYYRLKNKTTNAETAWASRPLSRFGSDPKAAAWTLLNGLNAQTDIAGIEPNSQYTLQYYFVATNVHGLTAQTSTYGDITLKSGACVR